MQRYLILLIGLFLFSACTDDSNAPSTGNKDMAVDISIQVSNISPGKVLLVGTFTDQNYKMDSTTIDANGLLRFQRAEPYKPGMYFVVFPGNKNMQLLLDKDQTMTITADGGDLVANTQVEGSIDTKLLMENFMYERRHNDALSAVKAKISRTAKSDPEYPKLQAEEKALAVQRKADLEQVFSQYPSSLYTSFKRSGQNPDIADVRNPDGTVNEPYQVYLYRTAFWDNVDFNDERLLYTPVIYNKLKRYMGQLTPQNADSIIASADFLTEKVLAYPEYFKYIANYIVLTYKTAESTIMDPEKVYVHMIQKYFTKEKAFWSDSMTVYGLQRRAFEMASSLVGQKGPDVISKDPQGQTKSIYNLKSDYIVVYIYNPTCEHCMEQTPKLVRLHQQSSRKELDVFAIAIDTNKEEWTEYIRKNKMNWTNVYDPTNKSIFAKYYVDITPEVYVLNRDRTIIAKNINVDQIRQIMERDQQ